MQYLRVQRENMLNKWRTITSQDLIMNNKISFSREEFNDQTPVILNILDQRLTGKPQESDLVEVAQQHGLQRWQRGYSLTELN